CLVFLSLRLLHLTSLRSSAPLAVFFFVSFFVNAAATTEIYTLSLHDALPISTTWPSAWRCCAAMGACAATDASPSRRPASKVKRSEEHTSELQSRVDLVCRLLLEKKKKRKQTRRKELHT